MTVHLWSVRMSFWVTSDDFGEGKGARDRFREILCPRITWSRSWEGTLPRKGLVERSSSALSPLTQARKDLNAGSAAPQKVLKNMLNEMNETILRNAYIFPLIKPTFYQRGGSLQLLISLNTKSAAILDSALCFKVTSLIAQLHRLNTVTAVVDKLIIVNGYFMLMTKC